MGESKILLYNWQKIFDHAQGNPNECFKIIKMLTEGTLPKNHYDPLYKYSLVNFVGDSFLLHPDVLIYNSFRYTVRDLSIYASLASLRPLGEYLRAEIIHLPKDLAPVEPLQYLDDPHSGLIKQDENNIYFLYESTPEITH